jgi:hypothetical protein
VIKLTENKLDPLALGISLGAVWAAYMFLLGVIVWFTGKGLLLLNVLNNLYSGYSGDFLGSVLGAIWGFAEGFIAGFVIALVYNKVKK